MKKLTLFLVAMLFSALSFAALNPFAYALSSTLSADETELTVNYSLNASATSVKWVLMDGNNEVKTVDLKSLGLEKGNYATTIPTTDFPTFKQLTWKIEVEGTSVTKPTQESTNYGLYCPHGLAIDNNSESENFGRIIVCESMHEVASKSATTYISGGKGAGLYVFNPDFTTDKTRYTGGNDFTRQLTSKGYQPYQVKISEDGRIFVSSCDINGVVVWEVSKDLNTWTPVISGTNDATDYTIKKDNAFFAGLNVAMDVKGSGDDLTLLLYSTNNKGIAFSQSGYRLDEYKLGKATTFTGTPKKILEGGKFGVVHTDVDFIYDGEGGYWFGGSRGGNAGQPNLVHIKADGTEDYRDETTTFYDGGGVLVHKGLLFKGLDRTSSTVGNFGIYTIGKDANGKTTLTQKWKVASTGLGRNHNEFAVDFAENLYVIGNSGEKILAYALPYSGSVSTPCASKYAFSIGKYTVTVNTNDVNKGTVTGGGEYGAGAVVTLTATPKEGYKLLYWSDRSTENPRTITVDGNEALSAYFVKEYTEEPTFSITKVWENTNVPDVNTNGYQAVGWDEKVYLQASDDKKIKVYSNGTDAAIDYANSGAGYQIAVDEVGNMIVYNGWFGAAKPNNILIYAKGSTTGKEVTFTLQNPGRCDFFSASGDIYSAEGGYVYFYCNETTAVNRLKITNGAATAADVTVDVVGGDLFAGCTQNYVIKDIFGNLVAHSRLNGIRALNVMTNEVSNFFILPNLKSNTLGGCSFELSGKEFWAYNVGTKAYTSEWSLYNVTDGKPVSAETLCTVDKTTTNKNKAANWLNAQVVDEKTAYIYQYCPTVGIAVWKVTRDHIVSATAENGTVGGAGTYKDNATATLTATANDGYRFKNWTKNGAVVSTVNPYSFTVTEDVELVANFDGPFCELILNTNDEEKGTVSGAGFYLQGQSATITATPKAGYKLLYWSDRSTQNPRTITMTKKEALSAYFVKVYDEEPTFAIEKVWENTNVPTATANGYQAVGWDGKIYMQNKTEGKIKVYTNGTDAAVDYATSNAYSQQIAVDDAGNLVLRNTASDFYNTTNSLVIYKKGETTGKVIDFEPVATGRSDFFSASGDFFSEKGGYVNIYCQNKTNVGRVHIKNGGATAADLVADVVGAGITAGNSQNHVMVDIFGNLVAHSRSNSVNWINVHTNECKTFTLPSIKLGTLGGCSFELGGKEFWAYNVGTTNYTSEWNIYNMTDKVFLSSETLYTKNKTDKNSAANWLNVQVIDENTAYIYQFCPTVGAAVWKVSLINTVVIDDKAVNSTALAEYHGQIVTAKVTRAFNNDSYKTLTLPFDMNEEQIKAVFGETAIVHEFTSVGEANDMFYLHFEQTTPATIEAGKPYIIQLPETGDYDAKDGFTIEGVTINITPNPVVHGAITMQPILDGGGRLDQASQYWLASDNYLYSAGAHPTALLGLRAYFINSTGRPIRARVVYGENEATSIPTVVAPEDNVRKVLKDGQIIIIRGEKQYNIQGQVIE